MQFCGPASFIRSFRSFNHKRLLHISLVKHLQPTSMPKVKDQDLPVSALFGIAKPSGPSSMAVVNDLKRLVSASKLFMDEKIARENAEKLYSHGGASTKEKGRGKKRGRGREAEAKIGQGGTLDPLADGVLGTL